MTTVQKEKIARRKLSLLQLAQELGNVSKACHIVRYSWRQFYETRRNFQLYAAEGLIDQLSGPKGPHPNRVSEEVEAAILEHSLDLTSFSMSRPVQNSKTGLGLVLGGQIRLAYQFDDEVQLEYYRLQKISEGSISLQEGKAGTLDGPTEVGSGLAREDAVPLSQLIDVINERFGTDFNQADQFFFDQIVKAAVGDDGLRQAAAVNPEEKFRLVFKNLLDHMFVERLDQNEEIFVRYMNDTPFQQVVSAWMAAEAYRRLRG